MESANGVPGDKGGPPPPPSPLTGCYLLIVVGELYNEQHKDIILQRIVKGLLSWNLNECLVDLEKELAIITEQALEGEEARFGERLIQFASENLVTEILIHPAVSTLAQCMKNLLSSFTRHRHIIHAGYTFAANGSWALQDGTFSYVDFSEAFQELEVQRVVRAYENGITMDIHCASEGDWPRLPKENFAKACKIRINPTDVLTSGSPSISGFVEYLSPFLVSTSLENLLQSSDVVGNIRFSRPTLYVFPGGQGDAALFGINGFNMLLDGGYSRKACFWDFVRHLDRLDAVLMTRLNNSNVGGISSVLKRKRQDALYPQIGHFFCNIQERKAILSPDGDKDKDPLLINLLEEGQDIISNLRHLNLNSQVCYRDSEPINLYHKVGHGTLDMYVLSPAKDSREVREFLIKWNHSDQKLFANAKYSRDFSFPIQNLISISALLVWRPANPNDTITRILYPGSCPQNKIIEGLDRLKNLEFIKHATCTEKSLIPIATTKKTAKEAIFDKLITKEKVTSEKKENKFIENETPAVNGDIKEKDKLVKKSDSTESDRSLKIKKTDEPKIIENGDKPKTKPKTQKLRSDSQQRKKPIEKKSPTLTKKPVENGDIKKPVKQSPIFAPAKSAKDANNRKVIENKVKKEVDKTQAVSEPKPKVEKVERKPISRRPSAKKAPISPAKKIVNGVQKPDSISRKGKLDKEGTTDSSTVSTPSADQESVLKKDISKLTPEDLQRMKAQELAEMKEEQEAVKEIEAVFRKSEDHKSDEEEALRKVKDISIDDKLETEEYLIIEKEEIEQFSMEEKETKDENQKLARDNEESEKQRKTSAEEQKLLEQVNAVSAELEEKPKAQEEPLVTSKVTSPEEKVDGSTDKKITDKEGEEKDIIESQPDEKVSGNIKSGDTTTAPTLPEDERIPLDEIKEDIDPIEEKYVKEETKEKEVPTIHIPPKTFETVTKLPPVVGIRLDKQQHIRDIVKTPDEVADLPVHEEVDYEYTQELKAETPKSNDIMEKKDEKEKEHEPGLTKEQVKEEEQEKDKDEVDMKKSNVMQKELKTLTDTVLQNEAILEKDILKDSEKEVTSLKQDEGDAKLESKEFKTEEKIKKAEVEILEETTIKKSIETIESSVHESMNRKKRSLHYVEPEKEDTGGLIESEIKEENNEQNKEITEKIKEIKADIKAEKQITETEAIPEVNEYIKDIQSENKEDTKEIRIDEGEKQDSPKEPEVIPTVEQVQEEIVKLSEKAKQESKDTNDQLKRIDEKLQNLKDALVDTEIKVDHTINIMDTKDEKLQEEVEKVADILSEVDKLELGRKSPKEREEDVMKIVAGVAEVLKSEVPLEEFEAKIPITTSFSTYSTPYTTELRETHITSADSPIIEMKVINTDIPPIPEEPHSVTASFLEEERKIAPIHEGDMPKSEDKRNSLLKESQELMMATSKMLSNIKSAKSEPQQSKEKAEEKIEEKSEEEIGTVHRMLVTASSEDGGEETEICPPGTITFSRSSESSGRSSPDPSHKTSHKSSIIDTVSETLSTIRQVADVHSEKDSGIDDAEQKKDEKDPSQSKEEKLEVTSGKSSPDKDDSIKSLASGKSTPDMSDLEKSKEVSSVEEVKKDLHTDIEIDKGIEEMLTSVEKLIHSSKEEDATPYISQNLDRKETISKEEESKLPKADKVFEENSYSISAVISDIEKEFKEVTDSVLESAKTTNETAKEKITDVGTLDNGEDIKHDIIKETDKLIKDVKECVDEKPERIKDELTDLNEIKDKSKIAEDDFIDNKEDLLIDTLDNLIQNKDELLDGTKDLVKEQKQKAADSVSAIKDSLVENKEELETIVHEAIKDKTDDLNKNKEEIKDTIIAIKDDIVDKKQAVKLEMSDTISDLTNTNEKLVEDSKKLEVDKKQEAQSLIQEITEGISGITDHIGHLNKTKDDIQDTMEAAKDDFLDKNEDVKIEIHDLGKKKDDFIDKAKNLVEDKTQAGETVVSDILISTKTTLLQSAQDIEENVEEKVNNLTKWKDELVHEIKDLDHEKDKAEDELNNILDKKDETLEGLIGIKDNILNEKAQLEEDLHSEVDKQIDNLTQKKDEIKTFSKDIGDQIGEYTESIIFTTDDIIKHKKQELETDLKDILKESADTAAETKSDAINVIKSTETDILDKKEELTDKLHKEMEEVTDFKDKVHDKLQEKVDDIRQKKNEIIDTVKDCKEDVEQSTEKLATGFLEDVKHIKDEVHDTLKEKVDDMHQKKNEIKDAAKDLKKDVEQTTEKLTIGFLEGVKNIKDAVHDNLKEEVEDVHQKKDEIKDPAKDLKKDVEQTTEKLTTGFLEGVKNIKDAVHDNLKEEVEDVHQKKDEIKDAAKDLKKDVEQTTEKLSTGFLEGVQNIKDEIHENIKEKVDDMHQNKDEIKDTAKDLKKDVEQTTEKLSTGFLEGVKNIKDEIHENIKEKVDDMHQKKDEIKATAKDLKKEVEQTNEKLTTGFLEDVKNIKDAVHDTLKEEVEDIHQKKDEIKDAAKDLKKDVEQTTEKLTTGFLEGVTNIKDEVHDDLKEKVDDIYQKKDEIKDTAKDLKKDVEQTTEKLSTGFLEDVKNIKDEIHENIKEKVDDMHQKKDEIKDTAKDLKKDVEQTTKKLSTGFLEGVKNIKDEIHENIKEKVDDMHQKKDEIKATAKDLKKEVEQTNEKLTTGFLEDVKIIKDAVHDTLKEEVEDIHQKKDEIKDAAKDLKKDVEQTTEKLTTGFLEGVTNIKHEVHDDLKEKVDDIYQKKDEIKDAAKDLKKDVEQTTEKLTTGFLEGVTNIKDEIHENIKEKVDDMHQKKDEIKDAAKDLRKDVEQTTEKLSTDFLEGVKNIKDEVHDDLKEKVDDIYQKKDEIKDTAKDLKKDVEQTTEKLSTGFLEDVKNIKDEIHENIKEKVDDMHQKKDEIKDTAKDLKKDVEQTTKKLSTGFLEGVKNIKDEIHENIKEKVDDMHQKKDEIKATAKDLKKEVEQTNEKLTTGFLEDVKIIKDAVHDTLKEEVEDIHQKKDEIKDAAKDLKKDVEQTTEKLTTGFLEGVTNIKHEVHDDLKEKVDDIYQKKDEIKDAAKDLKKDVEQTTEKLTTGFLEGVTNIKDEIHENIKEKVDDMHQKKDEIKDAAKDLRKDVEQTTEKLSTDFLEGVKNIKDEVHDDLKEKVDDIYQKKGEIKDTAKDLKKDVEQTTEKLTTGFLEDVKNIKDTVHDTLKEKSDDMHQKKDEIIDTAKDIKEDIGQTTEKLVTGLLEGVKDFKGEVHDKLEEKIDGMNQKKDEIVDATKEIKDDIEQTTEKIPAKLVDGLKEVKDDIFRQAKDLKDGKDKVVDTSQQFVNDVHKTVDQTITNVKDELNSVMEENIEQVLKDTEEHVLEEKHKLESAIKDKGDDLNKGKEEVLEVINEKKDEIKKDVQATLSPLDHIDHSIADKVVEGNIQTAIADIIKVAEESVQEEQEKLETKFQAKVDDGTKATGKLSENMETFKSDFGDNKEKLSDDITKEKLDEAKILIDHIVDDASDIKKNILGTKEIFEETLIKSETDSITKKIEKHLDSALVQSSSTIHSKNDEKEDKSPSEIETMDEKVIKKEQILQDSAKDLDETYDNIVTMAQSVIFNKCNVSDEVGTNDLESVKNVSAEKYDITKAEGTLEQYTKDLEETFEMVEDMSKSVIFEKCDEPEKIDHGETCDTTKSISFEKCDVSEDAHKENKDIKALTKDLELVENVSAEDSDITKAEATLEQYTKDLEETFEVVEDMTKSVIFEKCDQPEKTHHGEKCDMTKSVIFEKCDEFEKGEKETMEKSKERKPSLPVDRPGIQVAPPEKEKIENKTVELCDKDSSKRSSLKDDSEKERQDNLLHEKQFPGRITPPTVPVSPNITDEVKFSSSTEALIKEPGPRGGSDPETLTTLTDLSSEQFSKETLERESDDEEEQYSITSQVAHSRDSSHGDYDLLRNQDPMSMSFYGALPDEEKTVPETSTDKTDSKKKEEPSSDAQAVSSADHEKKDPIESWGKPLELPAPTCVDEITNAKYSTPDFRREVEQTNISTSRQSQDVDMTASFYGNLPANDLDPIYSWGKPLGLPSPAAPNDSKGTPKKERKLPATVTTKNKLNDDKKRAESPSKYNKNKKINPVYVDLTYVPHHGNSYYASVDFFRKVRARYYVFSGIEPSREVYNALLEAKQTWEDKELEVTIIPTYDTDILGYWVAENEELLTKYKIDLSPSASRCTINLQDHETSCSAYRLEF